VSGCVMIIGAGILQEPAIRTAKQMSLEVLVTDIYPEAPGLRWADYVELGHTILSELPLYPAQSRSI